jgi:predicted anti-sigma-YlaC factor YlaD
VTHQEAVDTLATERYLLDDMAGTDREAFEEHFFSCEACAADLRTASAMLQGAQEGFAGQATSNVVTMPVKRAAVSAPAWYRSAAPAWAAAAVLALVAGYQSLVVVPSLRQDTGPSRDRACHAASGESRRRDHRGAGLAHRGRQPGA